MDLGGESLYLIKKEDIIDSFLNTLKLFKMKQKLFTALLFATAFGLNAQTPSLLKSNGSTQDDLAYSICSDESNNNYVGGYFSGTLTDGSITLTNSGAQDLYIAKYDQQGQIIWARKGGGSGYDIVNFVHYNNGYLYVSGVFNGAATFGSSTLISEGQDDGFLAKYDTAGNFIWVKQFGSVWLDRVDKVAFMNVGGTTNLLVTASLGSGTVYNGTPLTGRGSIEAYILRLDTAGNLLNYKNFGGTSNDYAGDLILKNNLLYFNSLFASTTFYADTFSKNNNSTIGLYDGCMMVLDTALNVKWLRSFGGANFDGPIKTLVDDNGNSYVAGFYIGSAMFDTISIVGSSNIQDGFIAKYNSLGNPVWVKNLNSSTFSSFRSLSFGATQNEIIGWGHFQTNMSINNQTYNSASASIFDLFAINYLSDGTVNKVDIWGSTNEETINDLVVNPNGNIWVCGGFKTSTTFNGQNYTAVGGADIALWKFTGFNTGLKNPLPNALTLLNIFPNPTSGSIQLNSDNTITEISVFDQLGKLVYNAKVTAKNPSLELNLPNGVYFVQAKTETEMLKQKLVINK
jgi:hypothetical protein